MHFSTAVILAVSAVALARPIRYFRRENLATGTCGLPEIEFIEGVPGVSDSFFDSANQADFPHGPDVDIVIIADFICDTLESHCDAPASTVSICQNATDVVSQVYQISGGAAADAFNAILQIATDFASLDDSDSDVSNSDNSQNDDSNNNNGDNSGNNQDSNDNQDSSNDNQDSSNDNQDNSNNDNSQNNADNQANSNSALDFGSCGSPEIEFANGLDGRNEPAFEPINQADFNHGSALNIGVITNFVCGQLQSKCKASASTVQTCQDAANAASQQQGGAAADAFNAALGIQSNFAAVKAARDLEAVTLSERAGGNLQTFTGTLGASAPAVSALGNGQFQVDGNASFKDLQNALVRDVQHNQCANAANASGNKGALTVQACGAQQDQCNALARS